MTFAEHGKPIHFGCHIKNTKVMGGSLGEMPSLPSPLPHPVLWWVWDRKSNFLAELLFLSLSYEVIRRRTYIVSRIIKPLKWCHRNARLSCWRPTPLCHCLNTKFIVTKVTKIHVLHEPDMWLSIPLSVFFLLPVLRAQSLTYWQNMRRRTRSTVAVLLKVIHVCKVVKWRQFSHQFSILRVTLFVLGVYT